MIDVERGLLGLETVSDQATEEMDDKIRWAAMTRMLDLADVLELVVDGLNDGPFVYQQPIGEIHQAIRHMLTNLGDQSDATLLP